LITWEVTGSPSAAYLALPLTLVIGNAANSNNVVPVATLSFSSKIYISNATVTATVPTSISAGQNYTVEAKYDDLTTSVTLLSCYSPQFAITSTAVASTTTSVVTTTTKSGAVGGSVAGVAAAGVLALFL
ncbi:hypothetical protein HK100_012520, partial [Physocladia obscura]